MNKLIAAALATTALCAPAMAQDKISEFRIGVLGGENAQDRVQSNACLVKYTEEALGVPVKVFTPADYDGVIQGLLGGTLDMAVMGASSYAKIYLEDPEAVTPVLTTENPDGSLGYYSIGFARKDSGVKTLIDLQDKKFGFGDPNSTSGYLIPSIEIPEVTGHSMDNGDFFGEVVFTGGHEQTIVAVNNGDVDAGVTWADGMGNWEDGYNNGALRKAVDAGLVDMNDMVEIWRSDVIVNGPLVLRNALPADVRAKMTEMMDNLYETDTDCAYGVVGGDSLGFTPITVDAYKSIFAARKAAIGG